MSIASLSANFSNSLSISRVNAVTPLRPRIAQERIAQERTAPSKPDAPKPDPSTNQTPTTAERTRLRSRQSESGSLTLTTDEGDKVTISFRNQQSTRVDQTRLYGPNGSFESTRTRSRESSQLSVSLDGELSEAELKDITDLVNRLSTSQQEIATAPEDLGTLQSYNFAYQQSSQHSFKSTRVSVTA